MEIIYTQSLDNSMAWDDLNQYLCSPDAANVELALTLLENNPRATPQAAAGLTLLNQFGEAAQQARARVLLNSYLSRQAVAQWEQPLRVFAPTSGETMNWLAFNRWIQLYEMQRHEYEEFILQNPLFIKHYFRLLQSLVHEFKQWAVAFQYAERLLVRQPDNLEARLYWVDALLFHYFPRGEKLDLVEDAQQWIHRVEQAHPRAAGVAAYRLGLVATHYLPDVAEACRQYERAIQNGLQYPHRTEALAAVGRYYAQQSDWTRAKYYLEQAQQEDNAKHINEWLGLVYWQGYGQTEEAITLLKRACAFDLHLVEARLWLGQLYQSLGQRHNAQLYLEQALRLAPDSLVIQEALKLLI